MKSEAVNSCYCNPSGYKTYLHSLRENDEDMFWRFFDGGASKDDAFARAKWNYDIHFLPYIKKYVIDNQCSLDIGYGNGAQVLQSAEYFKDAVGLDVHEEGDAVFEELLMRGAENVLLFDGDGESIPLPDRSVDFIHSWVTFMHLGYIATFEKYLRESFRVLKEEGVACIYFARAVITRGVPATKKQWELDCKTERDQKVTYIEGNEHTRVNICNLRVSLWYAEQMCKDIGFNILDTTCSTKEVNKKIVVGGQHGLVVRKPENA